MADRLWVLIAAAGKPELLARTLLSLAATVKPSQYQGTLVVENGPRSGIEEVVRGFAGEHRFRHCYVAMANKSYALNCGLQQLGDGLVFMTDDDVRFDPQVLAAYASAAQDAQRGAFFGGPVLIDAEHGLPPPWQRRFYPQTIAEPWSLPYEQPTETLGQSFMGTNWAAFAGDLRNAGGFDTRLGPGGTTGAAGQETEAQRRLEAGGARPIYLPGAIAWHYLHREFLSDEWLLQRTYRHALEWGIRRTRNNNSIGPVLRAALGRWNAQAKGLVLRLLGGEERRFEAAFHQVKWRGRWEGIWLGRRWDRLPKMNLPELPSTAARAA